MQWKLLDEQDGQRTFALALETGDEVMSTIKSFAGQHGLRGSRFTAIGAFERVTLAFFDWDTKEYQHIPIEEQVEVLSLVGRITDKGDAPALHAHVVVGKRDGTAHGGHLMEARARPTVEVVLVDSPARIERRFDPESGLSLIRFA